MKVQGCQSFQPLLKWAGGKTSELKEIDPRIPTHKRYFEPFFGGGSVYFNSVSVPSFANDTHEDLMMFYRCVKSKDATFLRCLDSFLELWEGNLENRPKLYLDIRARYNNTKKPSAQKAVDFFILREYAYGGMFRLNSKGGFNVPFGHNYINKDIRKKIEHITSYGVAKKLESLELYNTDFLRFVKKFSFNEWDFMFIDPPYHCSFTKYGDKDFNVNDHKRLSGFLLSFKGKFMLVIQYTDLIKELYKDSGLNISLYSKKYKFNIKGRFNRSVEHALITNYDTNI